MMITGYGTANISEARGHSEAIHWPLNPVCVQEKGMLLALARLDPAGASSWPHERKGKPVRAALLATELVLPAKASSILLDGKPVPAAAPFKKKAKAASVVGVREGKVGVAIRVFAVQGCEDFEPEFVLQGESGAIRYTVYHYRGEPVKLKEKTVRVGLLVASAPCKTDDDLVALMNGLKKASIDDHVSRRTWQVRAKAGELTLEMGADLARHEPLYRRVDGKAFASERLTVDGVDLR
jgi:hypothetical protein